ncbi:MAG TPA: 16S rRNA (cytosine(1402)-N(4))-methyltransferase RsmH [Spirochaetota bacterium]|nr:16S rRNA (cytosine(1402)-N(4))-methyltransferase RsmH [Spirochaetota bacterium]
MFGGGVINTYVHSPVMKDEIIKSLLGEKDILFLDCTVGEGGHSEAVLNKFSNIRVIGVDRDSEILEVAKTRLSSYGTRFTPLNVNFKNLDFKKDLNEQKIDSALIDLGISVYHYKSSMRGFSFSQREKLNMKLDNEAISVYDIINSYSYETLVKIFFEYSEERFSREIVKKIIKEREIKTIEFTDDLANIIVSAIPPKFRGGKIHPATKIFQALRIEANRELDNIKEGIPKVISLLKNGGKLGVITFHSIEDRIVKNIFKFMELDCICPPRFPKCICDKKRSVNILGKAIIANEEEIRNNPPSRSAKLRIVEKVE